MELLAELQREFGLLYILISRELSLVRSVRDRIAVMYAGEKVEELDPSLFETEGTHRYYRLLHASMLELAAAGSMALTARRSPAHQISCALPPRLGIA